jgi:hypothetical protein
VFELELQQPGYGAVVFDDQNARSGPHCVLRVRTSILLDRLSGPRPFAQMQLTRRL